MTENKFYEELNNKETFEIRFMSVNEKDPMLKNYENKRWTKLSTLFESKEGKIDELRG